MSSFHNDAVKFMQDLLILLREEAKSTKSGTQVGQESPEKVLLRLLGVIPEANLFGSNQIFTQSQNTLPAESLLRNFFKIQTNATFQDLKTINSMLKSFRSRLNRYSRARTKIKLNRINKLITIPDNPINPDQLIQSTPEETKREVSRRLQKLEKDRDLKGIFDQEIAANSALATSVDRLVIDIPENVGEFKDQLVSLLRATGKESNEIIETLSIQKSEFVKEASKLANIDNLLFNGEQTYNPNVRLSLLKVLDVLIFLTDRQQMKYNCSQCKNFLQGTTNACIFAGGGGVPRTPAVTVPNEQGNSVAGRLTQSTNSCKEVWGLESNQFYTPSDTIIQTLERRLRGN